MNEKIRGQNFIDRGKLYAMVEGAVPAEGEIDVILNKARELKGLSLDEVAALLRRPPTSAR